MQYLRGVRLTGGSTITQQLARNLLLSPERNLIRKVKERLIARELEQRLGKRRILEIYLNVVEWGEDVWGAESAARFYFRKSSKRLTAFESAYLASVLPAPRVELRDANQARATKLQGRVLDELYLSGLIQASDWKEARTRVEPARIFHPPSRENEAPLPLEDALNQSCGATRARIEIEIKRARPS